jgi:quinol monooxygenase YgiN
MIGRLATFQVQVDKVDEAVDVAKRAILVMTERGLQGYHGYLNLVDRSTGRFVAIQLWETEADAAAFISGPLYRELSGPLLPLVIAPPVSEVYEVAVRA